MPSIILDDFLNDIKIELQLAHKSSVDDKNLDMIHKVFGQIKKLKKENEKHKKFRKDLYEVCNIDERHTDEYIISAFRDIEESDEYEPHPKVVVDTMNDIINQVEARGWRDLNGHRNRLLKKYTKQTKVIEEMQDDWEVATEKIAQENSDLDNEIKRLKKSHSDTCSYWKNKVQELENENEKYKTALMNSSGSFKCDECCIHLTEDDVYRSVDEGRLLCESCSEGDE